MKFQLYFVLSLSLCFAGCSGEKDLAQVSMNLPDRHYIKLDVKPNPDFQPIKLEVDSFTSTTYEATIIDTTKFVPQITPGEPRAEGLLLSSMFRPGDPEAAPMQPSIPNDLEVMGGVIDDPRVIRGAHFPGLDQIDFDPPDPTIACGPNHLVQMVNSEIAFYSKSGTLQFNRRMGSQGSPGFFEDIGAGNFCFDPRCFYDHDVNRFVILCVEAYFGISESYLTFAISDDDDPNGIWYKYRTEAVYQVGGDLYWPDYPSLGLDQGGYYISGNLFTYDTFAFGGVSFRTVDKTPMLTGQPITVNDVISTSNSSVQMAQAFGNNNGLPIGVNTGTSNLFLSGIQNPFTNPTLVSASVGIPQIGFPSGADNDGGSVSVVDVRIMNAHQRDDKLYACHHVQDGNKLVCRWYEVDLNGWPSGTPTLGQSGQVDFGSNTSAFFPSVYSDSNGNVAMTFAKSSPTEKIRIGVAGRASNDPPGTMGTPVLFELSPAAVSGRFGDYFDITLDPDGTTFWMTGQLGTNGGWDTTINSFVIATPATLIPESFSTTRGTLAAGSFAELTESDNVDVSIRRSSSDVRSRTEFEIQSTSPLESPSSMEVTLEGSVFARTNVVQTIELFNYDTDSWEQVSSENATRFTDSVTTVNVPGDVSRFVEPGTGSVAARVHYESDIQRQRFTSNTDFFEWFVEP